MQRNTLKTMAICALIIGIGGLTLGYAALTQVLNVNTTATIQNSNSSWNIHIENAEVESGGGTVQVVTGTTLKITDNTATLEDVVLKAPGDWIQFFVIVKNDGNIDANLSSITMLNPTITGAGETKDTDEALIKGAYKFELVQITDASNGTVLHEGDTLAAGKSMYFLFKLSLATDLAELPTGDVTISGSGATFNYVQK